MSIVKLRDFKEVLRTQRAERPAGKLSQPAIAVLLERAGLKVKSQGTLSKLENRGRDFFLETWPNPSDRIVVLESYGFTHSDMLTLDEKHDLGIAPFLPQSGIHPVYAAEGNKVDHVGTVSAGNGASGVLLRQKDISAPDWVAAQFDLEFVFAAEVSGDSMTCEDVAKSIQAGSIVFFHRPNAKMQPRPGDKVYVHLQAEDVEVLKVFEPDRGHTVLTSYNRAAKPILVDESNPGVVQGIYLGHEVKGDRAR